MTPSDALKDLESLPPLPVPHYMTPPMWDWYRRAIGEPWQAIADQIARVCGTWPLDAALASAPDLLSDTIPRAVGSKALLNVTFCPWFTEYRLAAFEPDDGETPYLAGLSEANQVFSDLGDVCVRWGTTLANACLELELWPWIPKLRAWRTRIEVLFRVHFPSATMFWYGDRGFHETVAQRGLTHILRLPYSSPTGRPAIRSCPLFTLGAGLDRQFQVYRATRDGASGACVPFIALGSGLRLVPEKEAMEWEWAWDYDRTTSWMLGRAMFDPQIQQSAWLRGLCADFRGMPFVYLHPCPFDWRNLSDDGRMVRIAHFLAYARGALGLEPPGT